MNERVALVVGCNSGIGLSSIHCIADEFDVIYAIDIKQNNLIDLTNSKKVVFYHADLSEPDMVNSVIKKLLQTITAKKQILDSVIFSAGITIDGYTHEIPYNHLEKLFKVNFFSFFLIAKQILPMFILQNLGTIVVIGSISGQLIGAGGGSSAYESSKAALIQFTKSIAVDYAQHNIRANIISPGEITTKLLQNSNAQLENTNEMKSQRPYYVKNRPIEESGLPEEIGELVKYLISRKTNFMNGADIIVDGAYTLI